MKKVLFMCLAVVIAICSQAQEKRVTRKPDAIVHSDAPYRIFIGPKVGGSYSMVSGFPESYKLNPKGSVGFQGGLAANVHFGRYSKKSEGGTGAFGLQLEALYAQRTVKTDIENIKFSSIEVPVLLQYYVTPSLTIEAGPTIVIGMSVSPDELHRKTEEYVPPITTSENLIIKSGDFKGNDVMITAGVGYKHKSGLTASARYNLGMSKLAGNFEGKVSTITVSIGWMFCVNK